MKVTGSPTWSVMVASRYSAPSPLNLPPGSSMFLSNAGGLILLVRTYVMNDVTLWLFNIAMV